jgi:hypothetical protein
MSSHLELGNLHWCAPYLAAGQNNDLQRQIADPTMRDVKQYEQERDTTKFNQGKGILDPAMSNLAACCSSSWKAQRAPVQRRTSAHTHEGGGGSAGSIVWAARPSTIPGAVCCFLSSSSSLGSGWRQTSKKGIWAVPVFSAVLRLRPDREDMAAHKRACPGHRWGPPRCAHARDGGGS